MNNQTGMQLEERKRKRRCEHDCRDHIFSLQTLRSNPSKYDIKVQFCPKFQRDPLPPEQTFPEFNTDRKYFTSAFLLGVDKRILLKNEQQEIMDHQKQIRDSLEKHNQLIFPRPNSKHTLCSVCKEHYRNYYVHIVSDDHRDKVGLSSYNNHIKDLCYLYLDLWDGCEHKADRQAERLMQEEEERRQRIAECSIQEDSNSLADCQRGSREQRLDSNGNVLMPKSKMIRKTSRNQETVPIHRRKRSIHSSYEPLRKQMFGSQATSIHGVRERKERNYERERMKAMKGTDLDKYHKEFVALPGRDEDPFIILQPVHNGDRNSQISPKKSENVVAKALEETPEKSLSEMVVAVEEQRSIEIESHSKEMQKEVYFKKVLSVEQGELSRSFSDNSDGFFSRRTERKRGNSPERTPRAVDDKYQGKNQQSYNYPYRIPMPYSLPQGNPSEALKKESQRFKEGRSYGEMHPEMFKNHQEGYASPGYYYPPYGYPPMYDPQYGLQQKEHGWPSADKAKGKEPEKQPPYDYMRYPWHYPYYVPAVQPGSEEARAGVVVPAGEGSLPPPHPQPPSERKANSSSGYVANTNININLVSPMYMCPQGAPYSMPPSHYPMPHHSMMGPYGYQYNPFPGQVEGKGDTQFDPRISEKPAQYGKQPHYAGSQPHGPQPIAGQHGYPPPPPPPPAGSKGGQGRGQQGYYPPYNMQYHPGYLAGQQKPAPKKEA